MYGLDKQGSKKPALSLRGTACPDIDRESDLMRWLAKTRHYCGYLKQFASATKCTKRLLRFADRSDPRNDGVVLIGAPTATDPSDQVSTDKVDESSILSLTNMLFSYGKNRAGRFPNKSRLTMGNLNPVMPYYSPQFTIIKPVKSLANVEKGEFC